jgi:nucleotide-binding universal stress UspA family protein
MAERPAVVVGIDGSYPSLTALDFATDEAAWRDLPLRIVHAFGTPDRSDRTATAEPRAETRWMVADAKFRALARQPDLEVSTHLVGGPADRALLARSWPAELLVVGSRGLGGFPGLLAGSVSTRVATTARCPVVVVPGERTAPGGLVLLGVDAVQPSSAATEFAFEEAVQREAALTAVYGWASPRGREGHGLSTGGGFAEAKGAATRELAEALAGWSQKYPDVVVRREVVHSLDPARLLVARSSGAAIVVVGSRRRGEVRSLLLGSVGYALIHQAACPVALVHAPTSGT